jgi:hypothetical protein
MVSVVVVSAYWTAYVSIMILISTLYLFHEGLKSLQLFSISDSFRQWASGLLHNEESVCVSYAGQELVLSHCFLIYAIYTNLGIIYIYI